jgi:uncharacterized ParB-like nuclease family protein
MDEQSSSPVPSENNRTITVPVEQVVVDGERRPINKAKVAELKRSISSVGLLNPITVMVGKGEDGKETVRLVAGGHRLQAKIELGSATIQCTVLECDEALRFELAEIDEIFIRNDPSPAKHALLTGRRAEIIRELAVQEGTLSQNATASKQSQRRTGEITGPDSGSVRDHAEKTGESKDKVQRSRNRFEMIGRSILTTIVGTSLDKGIQLDALAKLPKEKQFELAKRASEGAAVLARATTGKPKPKPPQLVTPIDVGNALAEFVRWKNKYSGLEVMEGLTEQISEIREALSDALEGEEEDKDVEGEELGFEQGEASPKKRKKGNWWGRKGD